MDINVFFAGLDAAFGDGNRERIITYLKEQLNAADREKDYNAAVTVLNEMIGFYRSISDHKASILAADKAIALLRSLGYENTVPFGTTLLNAATAHRAAGDNIRALEFFSGALGILGHFLPADDLRLAAVYNNASSIYEEIGNYGEALDNLEKAAAILEKQQGMETAAATARTNMALVLLKTGRQDEALTCLEKAIDSFRAAGAESLGPSYAAALSGMAEVCYRMGSLEDAIRFYESSLEHIRKTVGENADYATTCRNCAVVWEALGKTDKAEALMLKAHDLFVALGMETVGPNAGPESAGDISVH